MARRIVILYVLLTTTFIIGGALAYATTPTQIDIRFTDVENIENG